MGGCLEVNFSSDFDFKSREASRLWKFIEKSKLLIGYRISIKANRCRYTGNPDPPNAPAPCLRSQTFVVVSSEETKSNVAIELVLSCFVLFCLCPQAPFVDGGRDGWRDGARDGARDPTIDPILDAAFDGVGVHSAATSVKKVCPSCSPLLW